tara:strand:- start:1578 stop:2594 length:1017 start_codon:yes stop_codon:yes gene_type:complete
MAKSVKFQIKNNSNVYIGTEATMGTAAVAGAALVELPVTDFSFSELAAGGQTLSVAPFRVGGGMTQSDTMVRAQRHDRMYEVSVTFMCTDAATKRVLLNLYEDGAVGGNLSSLLGSMPTTTLFEDGASNVVPVSLIFRDVAHDATSDMVFPGCMCTSMSWSGDIGSNGGVVMCTATFVTGYIPTGNSDLTYSSVTAVSAQQTTFNMHDLTKTEMNSGSAEDLLLYSFEINIARPVNRVGFDSGTNFKPMGYSLGGYEVTGSLTCKRDAESISAIPEATSFALDLDTGIYEILAPKCFVDAASISFDDDGFKQVVPFRATYTGATTATIFSFAGTASDS